MEINPHIIKPIEESFAENKPISEPLHNKALGKINDLSFTIDNRIVELIEHQSTINENF